MKLSEQMQKYFDRYDGWSGDIVPYEYREEWPRKAAQLEADLKVANEQRLQLEAENADLETINAELHEIFEDVPGDTLEQKAHRVMHELEVAHKRIADLGYDDPMTWEQHGV